VVVLGSPPLNSSGDPIGGDYIAFYAAGRVVLNGDGAHLYDHATVSSLQQAALDGRIPEFYDAFRNPPFFALPFVPLALLPLLPSFGLWAVLNFACLAAALWLLLDVVPELKPRWRGLAAVVFAFGPVYFGIIDGENATLSLLLYVLIYCSLLRGQDRAAGVWAAIGLFKPQLFVVFPLIFVATRRWRALAWYVGTAVVLGIVSLAVVGFDGMIGWLRILVDMETGNATRNAWRMHSLKSFFDLLAPGQPLASMLIFAAVAAGLLVVLYRAWRWSSDLPLLWALSSATGVLVDPHLVDYDLTVLVPAGVLMALHVPATRWLIVLLSIVVVVRPQVPVGDAYIQTSVVLLLALAGMLWRRLRRPALGDRRLAREGQLLLA